MGIKKIPLDEWNTFSQEEKDYHTLEYKKAFERNKRLMIISTRAIALICVIALFFIGFAILNATKEYGQIKDKYGKEAYCYLCGFESMKKCECQYKSMIYKFDDYKLTEEYKLQLADYNSQPCNYSKVIGSMENKLEINLSMPLI